MSAARAWRRSGISIPLGPHFPPGRLRRPAKPTRSRTTTRQPSDVSWRVGETMGGGRAEFLRICVTLTAGQSQPPPPPGVRNPTTYRLQSSVEPNEGTATTTKLRTLVGSFLARIDRQRNGVHGVLSSVLKVCGVQSGVLSGVLASNGVRKHAKAATCTQASTRNRVRARVAPPRSTGGRSLTKLPNPPAATPYKAYGIGLPKGLTYRDPPID